MAFGIKLVQNGVVIAPGTAVHPAPVTVTVGVLCYLSFTGVTSTFEWRLAGSPAGSHTVVSNRSSPSPTILTDIDGGSYTVTLIDDAFNTYTLDIVTPSASSVSSASGVTTYYSTYASLRANAQNSIATLFSVQNRETVGDQGGGLFLHDTSDSTSTDNDGTILLSGSKRIKRILGGSDVDVRWFGAKLRFELTVTGQDATAASSQVPFRNYSFLNGADYVGFHIWIRGAGAAGGIYKGHITDYNSTTHMWTLDTPIATSVTNADQLYASDDTAAFRRARDYANQHTNDFYSTGYDLRSGRVLVQRGVLFLPEGINDGFPVGVHLDNATIWGPYSESVACFDVIAPAQEFTGQLAFTGNGTVRGFGHFIRAWSDTVNNSDQMDMEIHGITFQDVKYAVTNARSGNCRVVLNNCKFANAGVAKGHFAGLTLYTPSGLSYAGIGDIFAAAAPTNFAEGWIHIGGSEGGVKCPHGIGTIIAIYGASMSPNSAAPIVDGQYWIILKRITNLTLDGCRFGGENAGMPVYLVDAESSPSDGSGAGSLVSFFGASSCPSTLPAFKHNVPCALPYIAPGAQIGAFIGAGQPPTISTDAYDKLSKRDTDWLMQAQTFGSGGQPNVNNSVIEELPAGCQPSTPFRSLSRMFRGLERMEYPAATVDTSGTVTDATVSTTNTTATTGQTLFGAATATKYASTDGVNPATTTRQKRFPESLTAGWYTAIVPYRAKLLKTSTSRLACYSTEGAVPGYIPFEDTDDQQATLSYSWYHNGSATANSHIAEYNLNVPVGGYIIIGPASLIRGKWGGNYLPLGATSAPSWMQKGSTTWDPASIANGAQEQKDITVTGCALGDFVAVSFSLDIGGLSLTGKVKTAGTVTATLQNNSGGAIDLGSGTVTAVTWRAF